MWSRMQQIAGKNMQWLQQTERANISVAVAIWDCQIYEWIADQKAIRYRKGNRNDHAWS